MRTVTSSIISLPTLSTAQSLMVDLVGIERQEKVSKGFAFHEKLTSWKDSKFSRLRTSADIHHAGSMAAVW
jgi:hypothetical protein